MVVLAILLFQLFVVGLYFTIMCFSQFKAGAQNIRFPRIIGYLSNIGVIFVVVATLGSNLYIPWQVLYKSKFLSDLGNYEAIETACVLVLVLVSTML